MYRLSSLLAFVTILYSALSTEVLNASYQPPSTSADRNQQTGRSINSEEIGDRRSATAGQPRRRMASAPAVDLTEMRTKLDNAWTNKAKLRIYSDYFLSMWMANRDSAIMIMEEMQALDVSEDSKKGYLYFQKGMMHSLNLDSSRYYHQKAKQYLDPEEDLDVYVSNGIRLGRSMLPGNDLIEAQSILLELLRLTRSEDEIKNRDDVIAIYQALGSLYTRAKASDLAINVFNRLLSIVGNEPSERCTILLSLSNAHTSANEYKKAFEVLKPCVDSDQLRQPLRIAVLSTAGRLMGQMDDYTASVNYYRQLLGLLENESFQQPGINFRRVFLGEAFLNSGDIERADSVKTEIENNKERQRPDQELYTLLFFAELSFEQGRYRDAVQYSDQAISFASRFNMENRTQDVHLTKANAHEALGEFEDALQAFRDFDYLNAQRSKMLEERELANQKVRFELAERERELQEASLTINKLSNNLVIIAFISVFILFGFAIFYYRNRLGFLLQEEETRNTIARDLHDDLSGTLSSISFFSAAIERSGAPDESEQTAKYLKLINQSASEAREKIHDIIWAINTKNDSWDDFQLKCKRHAADILDGLNIEFNFNSHLDNPLPSTISLRQNIWLVYKEIISNLARYSKASKVDISMESDKQFFQLRVYDDGIGFDKDEQKQGNGLRNIRKRVAQLEGIAKCTTSTGEGTEWVIRIPLKTT